MLAEGLELGWGPAPVLEHLAGCFDEVTDSVCAVEAGVGGLRDEIVDSVTKLMEEGHNLLVLEQTRLLRRWLGEVADQSSRWVASLSILIDVALIRR